MILGHIHHCYLAKARGSTRLIIEVCNARVECTCAGIQDEYEIVFILSNEVCPSGRRSNSAYLNAAPLWLLKRKIEYTDTLRHRA
jgi:hypothetical protein